MERKYISENRYKKTAKSINRKRNVKPKKSPKKKYKKKKENAKLSKFFRFAFCAVLLLVIATVTRVATREEDEPFIPVFFKTEVKENTDKINIAIYDSASINSNNLVITELEEYIYPMLLRIGSNYELKYEVISSINKVSNKEYEITLKNDDVVSSVNVKDTIDKIIKEKGKYYNKVDNVDKVDIKSSDKLTIYLKSDDEYFIYNLNIPIYIKDSKYSMYLVESNSNDNMLSLVRNSYASKEYIKYINVLRLNSEEEAIEKYKNGSIDVLFASSNNIVKMLGKYEYDIKSYNNGEGIFLLFNASSNLSSQKYIRQMVAYSIDRESILSELASSNARIIDLPYTYDEEKYKYDVYAAENILMSNGYKKQGLYYVKNGRYLTLDLAVNKDDEEKINIANGIKSDLIKVGVKVNINKLSGEDIKNSINSEKYDILLANVYMNENPSLSHIYENINVSTEIDSKINNVKASSVNDILSSINEFKTVLSDDVGIYGIYSKQSYIIYRKGIDLFQDINYMRLFGSYFNK